MMMTYETKMQAVNEYVTRLESAAATRPNDFPDQSRNGNLPHAAYVARIANDAAWGAIGYCDMRGIEYATIEDAVSAHRA